MVIDTRQYQISIDKIAETIEIMLERGESPVEVSTRLSTVSGIPIIVLYYWFYKNKNLLKDGVKRVSDFYGYKELLDENGNNVLLEME